MKKIIRACTSALSMDLVEGLLPDLKKKYEVVLLSSPGPQLDEAVVKHGVKGIAVPMERHISFKHDIVSLWRMIRVFRRERPAMVHSMTPKAGLLCMVAAWLTRVPVRIHTFTGLVWPTEKGLKRRILMATDWLTCACATHIIPEGEGVMMDLRNHGITKKPMKVLGYGNVKGVDMGRFSMRDDVRSKMEELKLRDDNRFTFLFVGRIVGDKGINELCDAFERLEESKPSIRLLLVGRFEDGLDPVSNKTREIFNSDNNIEVLGTKYGDELLAYYAVADCFVFPSYREGFPNTVLEAGAMGLPQIVTDINGSREIVKNGENGIVVPSKNSEELYQAMNKMVTDNEMREKMAANAREMISKRFDQNFVRQCLLDFYDEIL